MPVTVPQFDVGCRKRKRRPHDKAPVGEIITLDGHRLPRLYREMMLASLQPMEMQLRTT